MRLAFINEQVAYSYRGIRLPQHVVTNWLIENKPAYGDPMGTVDKAIEEGMTTERGRSLIKLAFERIKD